MQFIKKLLGIGSAEQAEIPTNNTIHPNPTIENLTGPAFKKEMATKSGAVLLDVRTAMEVRGGAIRNAMNIDFMSRSFTKQVAALDKSVTYFIYCRSGNRSGQACQVMHKMGFDVRNLEGGIGSFPS